MTLVTVEDRPGIAAAIFGPLSEAGVNVDMIVQNISETEGDVGQACLYRHDLFLPDQSGGPRAQGDGRCQKAAVRSTMTNWSWTPMWPKISVVGIGMRVTRRGCSDHV